MCLISEDVHPSSNSRLSWKKKLSKFIGLSYMASTTNVVYICLTFYFVNKPQDQDNILFSKCLKRKFIKVHTEQNNEICTKHISLMNAKFLGNLATNSYSSCKNVLIAHTIIHIELILMSCHSTISYRFFHFCTFSFFILIIKQNHFYVTLICS